MATMWTPWRRWSECPGGPSAWPCSRHSAGRQGCWTPWCVATVAVRRHGRCASPAARTACSGRVSAARGAVMDVESRGRWSGSRGVRLQGPQRRASGMRRRPSAAVRHGEEPRVWPTGWTAVTKRLEARHRRRTRASRDANCSCLPPLWFWRTRARQGRWSFLREVLPSGRVT